MIDIPQMLGDIQQQGSTTAKQFAAVTTDDGTVFQFYSSRCMSSFLLVILGSHSHLTIIGSNLSLVEEHLYLADFRVIAGSSRHLVGGCIISTYYLILGCLTANLIIRDAESHHIDTHICGRLIWIAAIDTFEECIEHRINLHIAIIVDGYLVVGL